MRRLLLALAFLWPAVAGAQVLGQGGGIQVVIGAGAVGVTSCTLAACNTDAAAGYQINGVTAFNIIGTGLNSIPVGGVGAGANLPNTASFATIYGYNAGAAESNAGAIEFSAFGNGACQSLTSSIAHDTCIGVYAMHYETTGTGDTATGGDSMRDSVGVTNGTAYGSQTHVAYFGQLSSVVGANALYGNAAGVLFSGSVVAGDVITLTFTSTGITGSPVSVPYTVQAGDTVAAIASAFITQISNTAALNTAGIQASATGNINPGALAIVWNNTSTIGATPLTVTGGTTGAEVITVTGGVAATATNNNAFGAFSEGGLRMTTATGNNGFGNDTLNALTTGVSNSCVGDQCGRNATSANFISALGALSCLNCTTDHNMALVGDSTAASCAGCRNISILGSQAGKTTLTTANDVTIISDGSACDTNTSNQLLVCGSGGTFLNVQNTNTAGAQKAFWSGPVFLGATRFTTTGCTAGTLTGQGSSGTYNSGTTGTCTVAITLNGATGITAPNGWICTAFDRTTPANIQLQTVSATTGCTISGPTTTGDTIAFYAVPY